MDINAESQDQQRVHRGVQLLLFVIIAFALIGFFVGIDQGATESTPLIITEHSPHNTGSAVPAMSYGEMAQTATGPNAAWKSDFARIARAQTPLFEEYQPSEQARSRSWLARSEGRAYDGAPPVIPHAVDATSNNCMSCHGDSVRIGDATAGALPHPYLASCQQCHAPTYSKNFTTGFQPPVNTFQGLVAPLKGETAWQGAPPVIPHSTLMRSNCMACHGPDGDQGIRTPHPWQVSCLQCHAPSAKLDQRPHTEQPELISGLFSRRAVHETLANE
jgi:cytochrome c-type protein NapB